MFKKNKPFTARIKKKKKKQSKKTRNFNKLSRKKNTLYGSTKFEYTTSIYLKVFFLTIYNTLSHAYTAVSVVKNIWGSVVRFRSSTCRKTLKDLCVYSTELFTYLKKFVSTPEKRDRWECYLYIILYIEMRSVSEYFF